MKKYFKYSLISSPKLLSCSLPGRLLILFSVCTVHLLLLPAPPSTNRASIFYLLRPFDGNALSSHFFIVFCLNSFPLRWKPGYRGGLPGAPGGVSLAGLSAFSSSAHPTAVRLQSHLTRVTSQATLVAEEMNVCLSARPPTRAPLPFCPPSPLSLQPCRSSC